MKKTILILLLFTLACARKPQATIATWVPYDESLELSENANNESVRLRFKLIQSRVLDKNAIWKNVAAQISNFSEEDYQKLKPLVLEQDIPTIQSHIQDGSLTYETLTQWYLYRIVKYENNKNEYLNNIIAINPEAVNEARKRDKNKSSKDHPIYGMPILLKDNINFEGLPTTAGTELLKNNDAADAFIVKRIKEKGGIILGKANLSEWANFLCLECPNGYSAVGGQTLNPYGRKKFDTGGSSSGSASSVAANYAAAAVGTETSGSILSPSSSNSIVGLKPTTGLLSRSGIVPLSSTLDTPGPMTKNVIDSAILVSVMTGEDSADPVTENSPKDNKKYWEELQTASLKGVRFGVNKTFLKDSIYKLNVAKIVALGGIAIEFEPAKVDLEGFGTLLNADMRIDLPNYLKQYSSKELTLRTVSDIVAYNKQDSLDKIPYGQGRFEKILDTNLSTKELAELRVKLHDAGVKIFEQTMTEHQLDVILSINNWNAGEAAAANYPCLTVPMGYNATGQPIGITFISRPFQEDMLLKIGYAFEQATKARKLPKDYK
ncbi:MAG: amidase [Flavobacterium sp.]|jgi:amidase